MLGFKLVHRMIFFELVKVFLLALAGLTSILLLAGLVAEATQHGLGPSQILEAIPLLLPNMLPYTLPTTTLFATCIVYGRLAADNEVLAIKAAGVHIGHVMWPAVLLGLFTTAVTAALFVDIIPSTHFQLRNQIFANIEDYLYGMLRREGRIQHPQINYTIYVERVEGKVLRNALFLRRDAKTKQYDIIASAQEAKLRVDVDKKLIWVHMYNCDIVTNGQDNGHVEDKAWPVELPPQFEAGDKFRATDMTWLELDEFRQRLVDERNKMQLDIAVILSKYHNSRPPQLVLDHLRNLRNVVAMKTNQIAGIDTEVQMRPALALGCLCFVLIGCPVGIWFSKSDYLSAFITCFLPIIVIYYPLMLSGINLAKSRQVPAIAGLWTANALMLVIGMTLFRRLARN
ncbi:MAG: LptF/LptG family permease [Gemmataceae bacterium]|nr:LptF/LptG family permease [Gemmataceae bacterium]